MVKITDSTIIDRPVEEIWRCVSDVSNSPQWYQGRLEVRAEGPLAVGTTFEAAVHYHGRFWQALGEDLWEAFLLVGVCVGSLVFFRQHWNRQGRLAKGLAASSYTVYLTHPLVAVSVASAISTVALSPLLKCVIAVLIVLPLSFLVGLVLRKLPLANRVL